MEQDHQQEFLCVICNELILKPALLPCKHQFCCYCIRSIKYKHEDKHIKCPLCRRVTEWAPLNKERQLEIIRSILKRSNVRIFWGKGKTINDYDQNLTQSRGFFYIMINDKFIGDIIWGQGSQHNSYVDEVGRASGKIVRLTGGDFQYDNEYVTRYSNSPYQEWRGVFRAKGDGTFILEKGRYDWHGWSRSSSGALFMELKEILPGDELNMYNSSLNRFKVESQPQVQALEPVKYNCSQCKQVLLKPVILSCEHELCAYCIRSLKYDHPSKKVICPQCGCETREVEFNILREQQVINQIMKRKNTRVFWGKASTINDFDKNLTTSQGFFYILTDGELQGDIVWGGGSVHNSQLGEVGRATGRVKLLDFGQFQFDQSYGAKYSNNPTEDWSGSFIKKGDSTFVLQRGRYTWHGWGGRVSSGTLQMQLKELKPGDNLSLY